MLLTDGRTAMAKWTCVPAKIADRVIGDALIGGLVIGGWRSDGYEVGCLWRLVMGKKRVSSVSVRLKCLKGDFCGERVVVITEGDIKDMLNSMNRSHPANTSIVAFLEFMAKEMFVA